MQEDETGWVPRPEKLKLRSGKGILIGDVDILFLQKNVITDSSPSLSTNLYLIPVKNGRIQHNIKSVKIVNVNDKNHTRQ